MKLNRIYENDLRPQPPHRASRRSLSLTQIVLDDPSLSSKLCYSLRNSIPHNVRRCPQNLLVLPDPISAMGRAREASHVLVGRHRRPGACMLGRYTADEEDGRG